MSEEDHVPLAGEAQPFADPLENIDREAADAFIDALAAEVKRAEAQPAKRGGNLFLLITLGAFVLAGLGDWSPIDLGILVGVLLFHEGGHAAAMKLLGYRDVRVFFIPFLGAATTGRPPSDQPVKAAVVDLAGPLPGIVLALLLYLFAPSSELRNTTIGLLSMLNLINLLPLTPLDGGRLVERTVVARHPVFEIPFRLVVLVLFAWGAVAWRDVLLGFLAFVAFGQLVRGFSEGLPARRLRRQFTEPWPEDLEALDSQQREALYWATMRTDAPPELQQATAIRLHRRAGRRFPGPLAVFLLGLVWLAGIVVGLGTFAESQPEEPGVELPAEP